MVRVTIRCGRAYCPGSCGRTRISVMGGEAASVLANARRCQAHPGHLDARRKRSRRPSERYEDQGVRTLTIQLPGCGVS